MDALQLVQILAWPVAAIVFGVFFSVLFRRPISSVIARISKVSKSGVEALPPQQTESVSKVDPSPIHEPVAVQDPVLDEAEVDTRRLMPDADTDQLYTVVAGLGLALGFEKLHKAIYGSQLAVLQLLNQAGTVGLEARTLRPIYDQAAGQYPAIYSSDSFDRWLSFPEGNLVLRRDADQVFLTPRGRSFLVYLIRQGYLLAKPG